MALELIKDNCYLIDLDNEDIADSKLEFQFIPKAFERNRAVNMDSVAIVGKNVPSYHYTGGETTLSFELDFFAEEISRNDVMRRCNWLESLTYNEGRLVYPHRVVLSFGKMFRNQVWVVKSCSTTYDNFNKKHGFLPQQAYVRLTLGLWAELPLNASDIKRGFDSAIDNVGELTNEEAMRYLQTSNTAIGLESSAENSNARINANVLNSVEGIDRNVKAKELIQASKRAKNIKLIEKGVDFAKLGLAVSKAL